MSFASEYNAIRKKQKKEEEEKAKSRNSFLEEYKKAKVVADAEEKQRKEKAEKEAKARAERKKAQKKAYAEARTSVHKNYVKDKQIAKADKTIAPTELLEQMKKNRAEKEDPTAKYEVRPNSQYKSTQAYAPMQQKKNEEKNKPKKASITNKSDSVAPVKIEEDTWFEEQEINDVGDALGAVGATIGELATNIVKGAGNMVEGVTDAILYGASGVSSLVGADSFADDVRELAMDNTVNDLFAPVDDYLDEYSWLGEKSEGIAQGLGQVGTIILTGGAGGAMGLGSIGTSALTTGTMFTSSFGSGMSEAYQSGASDGDAVAYGAMKGLVDAGSELIFGGLGKGVKALGLSKGLSSADDILAKKVSERISNRFFKNLAQGTIKASAEGLEEVLAGVGTALAKQWTYKSNEEWEKLIEDENLLDQFIMGAITSGVAQGGDFVKSVKTDTDFITNLSTNEERVVNKEYENRVAAEESKGTVLSKKDKSQIYDKVLKDMERGYISTDTIESVVGVDPRNAFIESTAINSVEKEIDDLQKEYDKLNKMKNGDRTGEQDDQIDEVNDQVAEVTVGEPKAKKKKGKGLSTFIRNFVDKGAVFETLGLKKKNRALNDKYRAMSRSSAKAQYFLENGVGKKKSVLAVKKAVEKAGLSKEFYEYMYHKHNVDRMSLANRYIGASNKAVFGDSVTADMSRNAIKEIELKHPEFVELSQVIYDNLNTVRQKLVDNGRLSQETADMLAQMYPHYVPIKRLMDDEVDTNFWNNDKSVGVSTPIKGAKGGNERLGDMFNAIGNYVVQAYKAMDKNSFGIELKNTLKGKVQHHIDPLNINEVAETNGLSYLNDDELLQMGEDGATFTVFENGRRQTFNITEEMYEALKPTSEVMRETYKATSIPIQLFKKGVTEYNLPYSLVNFAKDIQGVFLNSKHSARTYANVPNAAFQILTNGKWNKEYSENGGGSVTYFDTSKNAFAKKKNIVSKVVGLPFEGISNVNRFFERLTRLSEYIASRKGGATIEASMQDAATVTTDFSAGGDMSKFADRNFVPFLNASIQGAAQEVRNVREAKANGLKGILKLASKYATVGISAMIFNALMWDDDEEYEELPDYVKDNYYIVGKYNDGSFVRIPKGRTVAVIQELFEQIANTVGGEETDWWNVFEMARSNLAPNDPINNNILAPIVQAVNGTTWYGEDLVPTRLQDKPDAEQYDETIDSISKWLGENTGLSPYKINYVLNQYSGIVGDMILPMLTPEAERGDSSLVGNMIAPFNDKFTVDSAFDNKNVSNFYEKSHELKVNANSSKATDEDILKSKYMTSINSKLGDLYNKKREIQGGNLSDSDKYSLVRDIQKEINTLAKNSLNSCENVNIQGNYATVGDLHYKLTDDGWEKISDAQLEKQNEVVSILGITPSQYWSNKAEYDMKAFYPDKYAVLQEEGISVEDYKENHEESAFIYTDDYSWAADNPGKYTLSKAVADDVTEYREYTSALSKIKADKDENGKTISGSAKAKKKEYIWSLDLDYGQKAILYRSLFDSKADKEEYNMDIVDYLNSRGDISYDEMNTILRELDFEVDEDGNISW